MKTFSLEEMKGLWRRRLGLLIDDCGCAVTRHDGTSLDALITDRIRGWYASLLLTEEPALLPVRDLTDEVTVAKRTGSNCIELEFPSKGVRPLLVQLTDWDEPLTIFHGPDSPALLRQRCERLAATPRHPLAVIVGRKLLLYGLRKADTGALAPDFALRRISRLEMVAFPEQANTFQLDESLLLTIPTDI